MAQIAKAVRNIKRAIGYLETVKPNEADKELLETIRKNVQLDADATERQRELELDDLRFCDPATQWSDKDRKSREDAGRPCLTEDRLGPFLMQVCNEQRKNKPGVQVNPVDGSGDIETAEILQGLIRHIEYNSNADTAYDTAFEWAVRCGRGFYRICTDYINDDGFEQEIQIKRVPNPHMVFVDPSAQEADYSDMKWGGFKAWMSQEDYKEQYPDSQLANAGTDAWLSVGDDAPEWMAEDGGACLVVEYFYKDFEKVTVKDGDRSREVLKAKVKWVKCTAVEILERGEFASKYIPIVAVLGKEVLVNNDRTYAGLIRAGKDPQKRHNYLLTSQVERIAFMPLASWLGYEGFAVNKNAFTNAHKVQMAILEYKGRGDDGMPIPPPQMITQEAPIRAVTEAMLGAEQGMKAVLGMYDPSLGNREENQSGVAIQRLQAQGETGNFHFQDNLSRAIRYEGRILLDLIPTVYDTERIIRIVGEDGTQQTVKVNGPITSEDEGPSKDSMGKVFDLTSGRYDITISAGPSYQSKRQEDRAMFMAALNSPMGELMAQRAGDLWAKTLDSPIAKELAERLMPPDIAQKEQQGGGQQIPPQMQQQVQVLMQQHQQLTQALNAAQDQIEQQTAKADAEMKKALLDSQTKLEIARMNNETELQKVMAQITAGGALPEIQKALNDLQQQHEDLAQLALAHHAAITGQQPAPEGEPEQPQAVPASEPPITASPMAGEEQQ